MVSSVTNALRRKTHSSPSLSCSPGKADWKDYRVSEAGPGYRGRHRLKWKAHSSQPGVVAHAWKPEHY